MKRKYADKREFSNILSATYKKIDINDDPHFVAATLVDVFEVEDKLTVGRKDGRIDTIVDVAYKWVTLFLKDEKYVIEVAFNAKSEIVEFVFDICKHVNYRTSVPVKDDLYLDVVITSRKEIEFIDEDALENAYKMGELSRKNYEMAKKTADKIVNKYGREDELRNLILAAQKYLSRLMAYTESREIVKKKPQKFEIEGIKEIFGKGEFAEERMEQFEEPKEKKSFLSKFFKPKPDAREEGLEVPEIPEEKKNDDNNTI